MEHYNKYPAYTASHNFRRILPQSAFDIYEDEQAETGLNMDDVRLFFMSFTACFLAVSAFIA